MEQFTIKLPEGLEYAEDGHTYKLNGKLIPGVTSIIDNLAKPALIGWAGKLVATTFREMLTAKHEYTDKELDEMFRVAKGAPYEKKTGAADKGKEAHKWIEQYICGKPLPIPSSAEVAYAVNAFLDWEKMYHPVWLASELLICSVKHEYAGTMDFACILKGKRMLGDIKTSAALYPSYYLQTAAYQNGAEEGGEHIDGRLLLRLPKKAGESIEMREVPTPYEFDLRTFLHLRELQRWVGAYNK